METSGCQQVTRDINKFVTINDINLANLMSLEGDNLKNPFLCYLNITSLHYKTVDLRHILEQIGIITHLAGQTYVWHGCKWNFAGPQIYLQPTEIKSQHFGVSLKFLVCY